MGVDHNGGALRRVKDNLGENRTSTSCFQRLLTVFIRKLVFIGMQALERDIFRRSSRPDLDILKLYSESFHYGEAPLPFCPIVHAAAKFLGMLARAL